MARQKVCEQCKDIKVKVNIQKPYPYIFYTTYSRVERMEGWGFVYLPLLLYHPYLVCILFGVPSLHIFTIFIFL